MTITQKQTDLIKKLIIAKSAAIGSVIAASPKTYDKDIEHLSTREASQWITVFLALPDNPDPSVPEVVSKAQRHGVNSRAGTCYSCHNPVDTNAGYWFTKPGGGFAEHHKVGECGEVKPVVNITEGVWRMGDEVWYVQPAKSGYLTARKVVESGLRYVKGGVMLLSNGGATPIVGEELQSIASQYGALHSHCIFCSKDLTDPRSDPRQGGVGYGPICAGKYDLPWGDIVIK